MPKRSSTQESNENTLAKNIVDQATGKEPNKNPAAVALGRLGGLKGGPARAAALSPEVRKAIAKEAAKKRWEKKQ